MTQINGVSVEGLSELNKQLRRAGADLSDLKALNQKAVNTVLPYVNSRVPMGDEDPGALLASVRGSATGAGAYIRAGSRSVPYAGVQEYGYSAGGAKKMDGQEYMRSALQAAESEWIDIYFDELTKIITRIANASYTGD